MLLRKREPNLEARHKAFLYQLQAADAVKEREYAAHFHAFNSPARLYLTHYEVLKSEERRMALFQKTRKVGVILDEAHKIKNPEADVTQTLHRLAGGFTRRVIMTGTPVANRPYDIWAPISFLDPGVPLGSDFGTFRADLDLANTLADE